MFRRRWSGLPDDPDFPADLEELGYYVNEIDEIRSITNPKFYFKYFLTKNERHNDRQRFAFNLAVQNLVHARLAALQLVKISLPLSAAPDEPYVPIFVSSALRAKKRVVLVFGERDQELGLLAHRVIGGPGGVDEGSMVSIVRALQGRRNYHADAVEDEDEDEDENEKMEEETGIVLANTGETWWWPEGRRPLCYRQSTGVRMRSAVMKGRRLDERANVIPGNKDADEHVRRLFESLLGDGDDGGGGEPPKYSVGRDAVVEVIGLTDGAVAVEKYLDANWARWGGRIGSLALVGGGQWVDDLRDEGFKKFLREKARAYITTNAPLGTPIANPGGNPHTVYFTSYGCPVFSAGEPYYTELALIKSKGLVLPWMTEVYRAGAGYVNPTLHVTFRDESFRDVPAWSGTPWDAYVDDGDDGRSRAAEVQEEEEQGEGGGGVEVITRDEWEKRQEEAEDKGVEADPSKVVVL